MGRFMSLVKAWKVAQPTPQCATKLPYLHTDEIYSKTATHLT